MPRKQASRERTAFTPGNPDHLLVLLDEGLVPEWVAVDTETSGLFADDGARVSTVSVAWPDPLRQWGPDRFDGINWAEEQIAPGLTAAIASVAWPFDQGRDGKPEAGGNATLWPDANNLDSDQWRALLTWLEEVGARGGLVMHNAPFDVEKLRVGVGRFNAEGIDGRDLCDYVVWDTQNVNHLLWGWEKTSLKPTLGRLWPDEHLEDEAEKVKEYLRKNKLPPGRWDLMPWDIIGKYADLDARGTARLRLRQQWEIHQGAGDWLDGSGGRLTVEAAVDRRLRTSKVLTRMTQRGMPYHESASLAAAEAARDVLVKLRQEFPFDPGRDKEVKHYYFGQDEGCLGLEPYAVSEKTGEPSLTAEVLGRMVNDGHPYAAELAAYRRVETAESMWYRGYAEKVGDDGRLRTYFRQNGTRSSRFSVERVQLQATPADYRFSGVQALEGIPTPMELFRRAVAEFYPGWTLYGLDLAQAELRIAALYARAHNMLEMMHSGEDMHGYTTTELFKVGPEDGRWGEFRQVGKRGNFSLCFGSGGATFQRMLAEQAGLRWTLEECTDVVRKWRRLYPAFVGADGRGGAVHRHSETVKARMMRSLRQGGPGVGYLSWKNGERRWFMRDEETHKAFNQRVQGDQAQYGIDWLLASETYLRSLGLDRPQAVQGDRWSWGRTRGGAAGLLLPVHDSQVLLLPDSTWGREVAEECAALGRTLWQEWFPGVPGDVEVKKW